MVFKSSRSILSRAEDCRRVLLTNFGRSTIYGDHQGSGLICFLVGHITKKGQIAGPKDLEHNADCVLHLRRAFSLRPLFVPKNRFAPAIFDPIVAIMDANGRLTKSKLNAAQSASVYGYAGMGDELAEGQASVSLPKYGSRSGLNAPYLPQKKIRQLIGVLSALKDIDLADLSYQINCYLPKKQSYREERPPYSYRLAEFISTVTGGARYALCRRIGSDRTCSSTRPTLFGRFSATSGWTTER